MKLRYFFGFMLVPASALAFFCPTNFSQINFGATPDQVIQMCGNPNKQETKNVDREVPEEWSYFVTQTVASTSLAPSQGTLKTTITFDENNKAVNITVNGIGVGASSICGPTIQLGDTKETIKRICGTPAFVNSQRSNYPTAGTIAGGPTGAPPVIKSDKVTTFFYNSNPPVKLIFMNGKLTERQ